MTSYSQKPKDDYIPEDQFGLGYINLLNIIGEIIHFVDSYEDKSHFSRINLLFIEEPEAISLLELQVVRTLKDSDASAKGDEASAPAGKPKLS